MLLYSTDYTINIFMSQQVFKSRYPILEAAMNKGSTLKLALAVHAAGGYPSLCAWCYGFGGVFDPDLMKKDLDSFVDKTGSNRVHLSFEFDFLEHVDQCLQIADAYKVPTVELIYGLANTPRPLHLMSANQNIASLTKPLHDMGTKIFRRIYDTVSAETKQAHYLDGFCIKGAEAGGFSSTKPLKQIFLEQQSLTPDALLIPHGGIGTPEQVKEYIDLGAEMVGIGTVLALSQEGPIKADARDIAIASQANQLSNFAQTFVTETGETVVRRQNVLKFQDFQQPDDFNRTRGLMAGLWDNSTDQGHIYFGQAIDHVHETLPCEQIIKHLVSAL